MEIALKFLERLLLLVLAGAAIWAGLMLNQGQEGSWRGARLLQRVLLILAGVVCLMVLLHTLGTRGA